MFTTIPPEINYILTGKKGEEEEEEEKPSKASKTKEEKPSKPSKKSAKVMVDDAEEEEEEENNDNTPDWSLPESSVKKLKANFAKVSDGEESISSGKAIKIFMKSGVKAKDIATVAKLVCNGQPKDINEKQFVAIMSMLGEIRKGIPVPKMLPDAYIEYLEGDKKPAKKETLSKSTKKPAKEVAVDEEEEEEEKEDWNLTKGMYNQLKKLFDKQTGGEETMAPALAVKTFKKSGVEEESVKAITKMVLRGHKGPISVGQFVVIMFILKKVSEGVEVPSSLPASLKKFL